MCKVPRAKYDKIYVGEAGRKFGVRLQERTTEVESKAQQAFTRNQRTASITGQKKSALIDHVTQENV